jgi:hypothetical protein
MARIRDGSSSADVTVSYLHDSLRELAEAARALLRGADQGRIVFMGEPGEAQLLFRRRGDALSYEVRWFDDWNSWGMHPSENFKVILSGTTTVRRFIGEVRGQMEALIQEHGLEGYRKRWVEHEFPMDLLTELRAGAKTEPGAAPNGGPAMRPGDSGASGGPPSVS